MLQLSLPLLFSVTVSELRSVEASPPGMSKEPSGTWILWSLGNFYSVLTLGHINNSKHTYPILESSVVEETLQSLYFWIVAFKKYIYCDSFASVFLPKLGCNWNDKLYVSGWLRVKGFIYWNRSSPPGKESLKLDLKKEDRQENMQCWPRRQV